MKKLMIIFFLSVINLAGIAKTTDTVKKLINQKEMLNYKELICSDIGDFIDERKQAWGANKFKQICVINIVEVSEEENLIKYSISYMLNFSYKKVNAIGYLKCNDEIVLIRSKNHPEIINILNASEITPEVYTKVKEKYPEGRFAGGTIYYYIIEYTKGNKHIEKIDEFEVARKYKEYKIMDSDIDILEFNEKHVRQIPSDSIEQYLPEFMKSKEGEK